MEIGKRDSVEVIDLPDEGKGEQLVDFLSGIQVDNAEAEVYVYRLVENKKNKPFVLHFVIGQMSVIELLTRLQEKYPQGGDFEVHVKENDGSKKFITRKQLSIEPTTQTRTEKTPDAGIMQTVEKLIERSDQRQAEALARMEENHKREIERLQKEQQNPVDPLELVTRCMDLAKSMVPAAPPTAPARRGSAIGELLEFFDLEDQLKERFSGKEGDESIVMTVIKQLPEIVQTLKEGGDPAALLPAPGKQANSITTANNGALQVDVKNLNTMLPLIKMVNSWAARGLDPALYAAMALDYVPASTAQELVGQADLLERVIAVYPAAANYRDWWEQFREQLKVELSERGNPVNTNSAGDHSTA